jgi:CTP-dependent riboflavin kinase
MRYEEFWNQPYTARELAEVLGCSQPVARRILEKTGHKQQVGRPKGRQSTAPKLTEELSQTRTDLAQTREALERCTTVVHELLDVLDAAQKRIDGEFHADI